MDGADEGREDKEGAGRSRTRMYPCLYETDEEYIFLNLFVDI